MAHQVNLRIRLGVFLFLLVMAGLAQAGTITVGPGADCDFDNIQAGIDAAVDGDTVTVAPGEYVITEPVTFRGKAITVKSEVGRDETTLRMGTPADANRACVVIFENSETDASILEGFTITGGRGLFNPSVKATGGGGIVFFNASSGTVKNCAIVQNSADAGGGVICAGNALATVNNCTIADNTVTIIGGGVYAVWGSSLTLTNCTITGNSATDSGGGVGCWQNSSVTLADCVIRGNSATGVIFHEAGYGGGLYAGDGSVMNLTNCSIENNSAGVGGGGMLLYGSPSTIAGCIISGNSAGWWGGGVACEKDLLSMTNCIIARNTAGEGGGGLACGSGGVLTVSNCTIRANLAGSMWGGGGVLCWQGSTTVINSIIWANTSSKGPEISVEEPISTLTIAHSDVAGGKADVHVQSGCILDWGEGNIDTDPCFADPDNEDFHLKSQAGRWEPVTQAWIKDDVTSPCIDGGDPDSDWTGETWPHGGRINMGAYGGTREASMSIRPEAMSLPRVAFIYRSDAKAAASFQSLLMRYGCPTTLIELNQVATALLDSYDLIIVGDDTGYLSNWGDSLSVSAIETSGKSVVGLGEGGYAFFGKLGLSIGWGHGWHGSNDRIYVMEPNYSLFSTPYAINIPDDRILHLYTQTGHVGIHLNPRPDTVVTLGREIDNLTHYPLVLENRYLLWGFTETPESMTEVGKTLFINVVIWTANAGWEIEI